MMSLPQAFAARRLSIALAAVIALAMPAAVRDARAACADTDTDGDGVCDTIDVCPRDGLDDADGDGFCVGAGFKTPKTGQNDNCPSAANASQVDQDTDGRGDACDLCPLAKGSAEDACLTTGYWAARAAIAISRSETGMTSVGGRNYLVGGQESSAKTMEVYDPTVNAWTTAPALPAKRHHIQPVVVKGKIYVIGGLVDFPGPSLDSVLMFDPANPGLGWQGRAPMPTTRGALGCAADGVKIYCAGGLSSAASDTAINAMEVYNTVSNTWASLAPMPRERDHFHAAIVNGKFYAVSGRDTLINATFGHNDVYDIATNTWSQKAALPTPRGGYSAAVVQGRLIVISGEGNGPSDGTFPNVDEYDPARNTWRALAPIPTPRHGTGVAVNTAEDGVIERVYVAGGGASQGGSRSAVHEVFSYRTGRLRCFAAGTSPGVFSGAMTTGPAYAWGNDLDPVLDSLTSPLLYANSTVNGSGGTADKVVYTLNVPAAGTWYLWARMYYPGAPGSNDANSFFAKIDSGTLKKLGNNRDYFRKWHWGGDGSKENGILKGLSLGSLSAGSHQLTIEKREVTPIPPRIDVLCLSDNANGGPTDAEACATLGACGPSTTTTTTLEASTTTTTTSTTTSTVPVTTTLEVTTTTTAPPTTTLPASTDVACIAAGAASSAGAFSGAMTKSTAYTAGADDDAAADSLTTPLVFASSTSNSKGENTDTVTYAFALPETATWYLWARMYYPGAPGSNDANSFSAKIDAGTLRKLGNNLGFFRKWHWGGNGEIETGPIVPMSLGTLSAGAHQVTILKREVVPIPPRLDVLCFTKAATPPSDAQACAALGGCP